MGLALALLGPACTGAACGAGTQLVDGTCVAVGAGDTDASEDTDRPSDGGDPPIILSFDAEEADLTAGGSVTFVAVVEDPQGAEDVALGALVTAGGETFGTFEPDGESRWTIEVSWEALQELGPIDFAEEDQRAFVAHFVDRSANIDEETASLRLHCGGIAACSGVCTDILNDAENCGTCGNVCDTCTTGQCLAYECVAGATTCDEACANVGLACGGDACSGGTTTGYMIGDGDDTCDAFTVYRLVDECDTPFIEGYELFGKCCCAS